MFRETLFTLLDSAGFDVAGMAYAAVAVFIAGLVRGFSGFGMSALMVLALSLILAPAQVVPMALMLEVAASLRMLPGTWRNVDWRFAGWLLAGSALGTPIGVLLLVHVPVPAMRAGLSVFVLGMSVLLWIGFRFRSRPAARWGLGVGVFSGIANGAAAFGGQPNALFLLSTAISAASVRATLVLLAFCTDIYGSAVAYASGLLTGAVATRAGLVLIPMVLGIAVGERYFRASKQGTYRRFALVLLMTLAVAGLVRAAIGGV